MLDSPALADAVSEYPSLWTCVVAGIWAWLFHAFIESLLFNALNLDSIESRGLKVLASTLVSGLSYGAVVTGAMFLIAIPVSIWSFAAFTLLGLVLGYRSARWLDFKP